MAPIVLKIKDDKPSRLNSTDELSKTWRVCTKVKDSLENGSRLENLSWRLWFAHNDKKKKSTVSSAAATLLNNFKIPDNFDFSKAQQQQQQKKEELEYKRNLILQQKKQAASILLQDKREEFTLHQYTSDQAVDQVIELDDIFNSFQSYLNPLEENPTSQQLDHLINASWPSSHTFTTSYTSYHSTPYHSTTTSPTLQQPTFHSTSNSPTSMQQEQSNAPSPSQTYLPYPQETAVYVTSEAMPPIPNGTLHNKLLTTLPKQTLESAERLLTTTKVNNNNNNRQSMFQSTPNTPFITASSSFQQNNYMDKSNVDSFIHQLNTISKSLPPSRATSPPAETPPKKRSVINSSPSEGKAPICSNCNTTTTPLWRRSANDELLCNACGLYLKLHNAPRPKYLKPQSSRKDVDKDDNFVQPLCSNCGTSTTPLWRRDLEGAPLCNACGLYLKLHHEKRPLSMKTDNIKKRQRCDTNTKSPKRKNREPEKQDDEYSPFGFFGLQLPI